MPTVFTTFDEYGETVALQVVPQNIVLESINHFTKYSYASHAPTMSVEDVSMAVDFMGQLHTIDASNNAKEESMLEFHNDIGEEK